jgi:hypothetical protein
MRKNNSTRLKVALIAWVVAVGAVAQADTNIANLRMFCQSVRIESGSASALSLAYYTEFSSFANWDQPNAEFFTLLSEEPPTHFSFFLLTGDVFQGLGGLEGGMWITVPEDLDANADGVPDFYQVAQAINTVTGGGEFQIYDPTDPTALVDYGTVQANWRRTAGEHRGQCDLTLASQAPASIRVLPASGLRFTHNFEVIEFAGTYSYRPAETRIEGMVTLAQVGNPERTRHGPMPLIRAELDPFNRLNILESAWTNQLGQTLTVTGGYLDRYPEFELQYYGPFSFDDGDLRTGDWDYEFYYVGIEDPNDYNGDGIPDLTDPPFERRPTLAIGGSGGAPLLSIAGEVGQTVRIQTTSNLSTTGWTDVQTVTLTNTSQSVPLPNPNAKTAFWRTLNEP